MKQYCVQLQISHKCRFSTFDYELFNILTFCSFINKKEVSRMNPTSRLVYLFHTKHSRCVTLEPSSELTEWDAHIILHLRPQCTSLEIQRNKSSSRMCSSLAHRKGFGVACNKTTTHTNCVYKSMVTAMLNTFRFMVTVTFETGIYLTGVNWTQMCCKYRSHDDQTWIFQKNKQIHYFYFPKLEKIGSADP
jgi:hypothetical protein